jgi:organic radical activating enzyme
MITEIKSYELEISSDCNASCPLCDRTQHKIPNWGNNNISLSDIKSLFPSKSDIDGIEFLFSGVIGDPIVNLECIEICEYLSENGAEIYISTNGGYNTIDWWKRFAKVKNLRVDFATDGGPKTNHIYRVNVKWENLLRNMQAFSRAGGQGSCTFIPFDHNEQEFEYVQQLAKELGFKLKARFHGRNITTNEKSIDRKTKQEVKIQGKPLTVSTHGDQEKLSTLAKKTEKPKDHIEELKKITPTVDCRTIRDRTLFIGADMTLWPCCHLYSENLNGRMNNHLPTGYNDLRTKTISEIINSEAFLTIQERWNVEHPYFLKRCIKTCAKGGFGANKTKIIS